MITLRGGSEFPERASSYFPLISFSLFDGWPSLSTPPLPSAMEPGGMVKPCSASNPNDRRGEAGSPSEAAVGREREQRGRPCRLPCRTWRARRPVETTSRRGGGAAPPPAVVGAEHVAGQELQIVAPNRNESNRANRIKSRPGCSIHLPAPEPPPPPVAQPAGLRSSGGAAKLLARPRRSLPPLVEKIEMRERERGGDCELQVMRAERAATATAARRGGGEAQSEIRRPRRCCTRSR